MALNSINSVVNKDYILRKRDTHDIDENLINVLDEYIVENLVLFSYFEITAEQIFARLKDRYRYNNFFLTELLANKICSYYKDTRGITCYSFVVLSYPSKSYIGFHLDIQNNSNVHVVSTLDKNTLIDLRVATNIR